MVKKSSFYCVLNSFMLLFIVIALISMSFLAGQMVHEQMHVSQTLKEQKHVGQVCYFGIKDYDTFSIGRSFVSGWVVMNDDNSVPHVPLDETTPYLYQAIVISICLFISLIILLRLLDLMFNGSAPLRLADHNTNVIEATQ